jgi:hypothetical protein
MKYMLISLIVLLLPIMNAHRLFGSWTPGPADHVPIENHLSDNALRVLEIAVDDAAAKHCQNSHCEKGFFGYFTHMLNFISGHLD